MENLMYKSTRGSKNYLTSAEAIKRGLAEDGGLYMPTSIPKIDLDFISGMVEDTYSARAFKVLSLYLTDYDSETLRKICEKAYSAERFVGGAAPIYSLNDKIDVLELWHGPTCAFKDMALQIMPMLLSEALKMTGEKNDALILVATSGDTGKAALEGYRDVDKIRIMVYYPENGVSAMQKLQMTTQQGENVGVCAIKGNFDDAQTGVKTIFTDPAVKEALEKNNMAFSSANSINWGRLVPQIVYYFSAYADMIASGQIKNGEKINFTVPTGNFGNILAAYYAKEMGLPVNKLICASNANNVLTEFINTGRYNRVRKFHQTVSPSMEILVSSNLERLLFHLSGDNSDEIRTLFSALSSDGEYTVNNDILAKIQDVFAAGCCDDTDTKKTIGETFRDYDYLSDPHTGVAVNVYNEYRRTSGDTTPTVIVSTASPYKFSPAVLEGLGESAASEDEFDMIAAVDRISGVTPPVKLTELRGASPRFTDICEKEEMQNVVFAMLGI